MKKSLCILLAALAATACQQATGSQMFQAEIAETNTSAPTSLVRYENVQLFNGEAFVPGPLCVADTLLVACSGQAAEVIDGTGGYVIPPFGDAHTHHFDSPYTLDWHRSLYMPVGIFYVMSTTTPTSSTVQIRDQLSGPDNVDLSTALGGITGPDSHPAEIYEALALGIRSYEEQVARADDIHASRLMADDAYFVVKNAEDVDAKWPLIMENRPDFIKVFLRKSDRYEEGYGKWGPGGGIDPQLLPLIVDKAKAEGLRVAVSVSNMADFRATLDAGADIVTHLPCYQDSGADPDSPYYDVDLAEECVLSAGDAAHAAEMGVASTLIMTEWKKQRPQDYVDWERANIAALESAGAPLFIGSNGYGSTIIDGLIAGQGLNFLSRPRLLEIATMDTPQLIFPDRRIGCLEPGCEASFLILDDNPLDDLSAIKSIRLAVKEGEPVAVEN